MGGGITMRLFSIIALVLALLTIGCGFSIHYGGEEFKNAITGHMVLGVLTLISVVIIVIKVFFQS